MLGRVNTHTFQFEEEVEDIKLLSRSLKKYNRHRRKKMTKLRLSALYRSFSILFTQSVH